MAYAGPVLPGQNEAYFRYSGQNTSLPSSSTPTPNYAPAYTFGDVTRQTSPSSPTPAPGPTPTPSGPSAEELLRQQQEETAQNAYNAQNQSLNTQYDYMAEQGRNQLGALGTQQQSEIGGVEAGLGDIRRQVGIAKTNTAESGAKQIKEAGSIARSTQGQNRNVLRALGILNSSAAGQILTKPMNTFDQQRAEVGQFIVKKSAELDDFVTQKVTEADRIKQDIMAKYSSLVNNIQTDLRFNERQRNDALGQANAAFQQHLTQLAQNTMQYQQQAQQQKQALLANLASATNYSNPTLNTALYQTLGLAQPRTQTAQIYQDPNKKKLGEF